jgi:hypothetical protein
MKSPSYFHHLEGVLCRGTISDRVDAFNSRQRGDAAGEALIGRRGELAAIQAFVQRTRRDGQAVVLVGEPGVGKTLLLDAAANMAESAGARVLRASGVEFEAELSFSGLNQILLHQAVVVRHASLFGHGSSGLAWRYTGWRERDRPWGDHDRSGAGAGRVHRLLAEAERGDA